MTGADLTPRQLRAIEALLVSDNRGVAAKGAEVSERTIYRWMLLPAFAEEVRRQRSQVLDATATALSAGSAVCARVLIKIAGGEIRANPTRVAAAKAVLDLANRYEESATLAARLEALENAVTRVEQQREPIGNFPQ